jgi:hypothetical protein
MIKIVESRTIRATRSDLLNDPTEIVFGKDAILEYGRKKKDAVPISIEQNSQWADDEFSFYNAVVDCRVDCESVYVSCFSIAEDILSEWAMYADDGKGVSIAFDRKELEKYLVQWHVRLEHGYPPGYERLRLVNYIKPDDIKQKIKDRLEQFKDDYLKRIAADGVENHSLNGVGKELNDACTDLILTTKNKCYEPEQECRLLATFRGNENYICDSFSVSSDPLFSGVNKHLYLPSNDNIPFPVAEIMVGPNYKHTERMHLIKELQKFVEARGLNGTRITGSNLPYRH